MKKNFLRSFLTLLISGQFYINTAWAQDLPDDPVTSPELIKIELSEVDAKELFDVLNKWKLVVTDRQTQTKNIQTSDVICVENIEDGRKLGCSLYDDLRLRELTKYNKFADPLFKLMVKHVSMECEDESETCMNAAEKMACSLTANKYSCSIEYLIPQPKPKSNKGNLK